MDKEPSQEGQACCFSAHNVSGVLKDYLFNCSCWLLISTLQILLQPSGLGLEELAKRICRLATVA